MAIYTALNTSQKQIRLLSLLPGEGDDQLVCKLFNVSLLNDVAYEALSYCWGPRTDQQSIEVNDEAVSVTQNLYAALKRLRLPDRNRALWIDALCINQDDFAERSHQVSLMSEIYTKTTCCLIWLGEEPAIPERTVSREQTMDVVRLVDEADELIASIAAQFPGLETEQFGLLLDSPIPVTSQQLIDEDAFRVAATRPCIWYGDERDDEHLTVGKGNGVGEDSVFHAFRLLRLLARDMHLNEIPYLEKTAETSFMNARRAAHWVTHRPWWTRIWTVQESVLPKAATVIYGPVQMPWSTILDAAFNFARHKASCCALLTNVVETLGTDGVLELDALRNRMSLGKELTLESLLRQFRPREATDARDKIYGLLGLVRDWGTEEPLMPDYFPQLQPEVVYADAMLKVIAASRSLDILCQPTEDHKTKGGLPSWLPNFEAPVGLLGSTDRYMEQLPLYNACAGSEAHVSLLEKKILRLEGTMIGHITRSTVFLSPGSMDSQVSTIKYWVEVAEEECGADESWKDTFWRTLCGDTVLVTEEGLQSAQHSSNFRRAYPDDEETFKCWALAHGFDKLYSPVLEPTENSGLTASVGAMNHAIRMNTINRRLFVTEDKCLGMAPSVAVVTFPKPDEIFLFPGGKTPFVLRSVGQRDVPGEGLRECHQLIGDCYLHRFMDGEGMEEFSRRSQTIYLV